MSPHPRILAVALATSLATLLSAAPNTYPNSLKYKDSGVPNAVAATTVASIEARALLNRDATTDVEITTGSFEGDAPSGYLTKVKVWIPTAGEPLPVNFNDAERATFSGNVSGVISGNVVTIDAQVRGLNNGTDHAVASATVTKRPDLGVAFVSLPTVVKGLPARVRTAITESNRSVGARANARLLLDGVEIDRAENIWVNAGGRVNITFAPVITAEDGQHDFTVVVDAMNPGDWDDANNTRTEHARVYNVVDELYSWSVTAREEESDNYDHQKRTWFEQMRTDHGVSQSYRLLGAIRAAVNLNAVQVTASGTSDGNPLFSASATQFSVRNTPVGQRCATSRGNPEVVLCFSSNTNVVQVDISYADGDVTYRSWGWATRENPFGPEVPLYTWDDTSETHTMQSRFGSTVALDYTISDGTNEWRTAPFINALTLSTTSTNSPYACNYDSFTQETVCRERRSSATVRSGSASGFAD